MLAEMQHYSFRGLGQKNCRETERKTVRIRSCPPRVLRPQSTRPIYAAKDKGEPSTRRTAAKSANDGDDSIFSGARLLDSRCARGLTDSRGNNEHDETNNEGVPPGWQAGAGGNPWWQARKARQVKPLHLNSTSPLSFKEETVNEVKSTNPAAHHGLPSHFPPGASGKGINLTGEETVNGAKSVNPTWHHGLPPQFPLGTKEKGITTRSPGTDLPTRVRGAPWLAGALAALVLSTSSLSLPQAAKADRLDVGRFDFAMRKLERDDGTGVEESLSGRLIGLVAVNVIGFQLVQMFLRKASDRSEPISVVKLQLGLLKDHNEIQNKLSELRGIIQVGKKGQWIILEETIRELSSHRSACSYAEVTNQAIESKEEAHKLFNKVAAQEMDKANNVEGLAISSDSSATETESDTEGGGGGGGGGGFMGGWFRSGSKRQIQSEACVVTLIVSARGRLDMSSSSDTWQDVRHAMQQLCGLSSERILAIELLWTPQKEGDFLTEEQLLLDYPNLKAIQ